MTFTHDAENKQLTVANGGGTLGAYLYDGDGKRVKKYNTSPTDNRLFIYDAAGKLIEERSTSGTYAVQTSYVYAGSRLLTVEHEKTSTTSYLTADHLGSPRINTDGSGNVTSRDDYLPFGESITSAITSQRTSGLGYVADSVRKQFTGYERDAEADLDFAQARIYSNSQGRFLSADPLLASAYVAHPQTFNRYSYVLNSPLTLTDPEGLAPVTGSACGQWCDRDAPYVDGSSFRGRDAMYDNLLSSLDSYSSHSAILGASRLLSGFLARITTIRMSVFASQESTLFSRLWSNRASKDGTSDILFDADGNPKYKNQCAIRLTYAFMFVPEIASEYFASFRGLKDQQFAIRAKDLAKWLPRVFGPPIKVTGSQKTEFLTGRKGIVFLDQFPGTRDPGTFNHIDLWNGFQFSRGDYRWIELARSVLFWPVP